MSLKNNVEGLSTVTTSTIHGQPFEKNMESVGNDMPSLFPEEDVVVTTLDGMHGNENVDQWEEFVNNDMDHSLTSDEYLIHGKHSFDGRFCFHYLIKWYFSKNNLPFGRITSQLATNCVELRMSKFLISCIVLQVYQKKCGN